MINALIYSEVSIDYEKFEDLDKAIPATIFRREPLPLRGSSDITGATFQALFFKTGKGMVARHSKPRWPASGVANVATTSLYAKLMGIWPMDPTPLARFKPGSPWPKP